MHSKLQAEKIKDQTYWEGFYVIILLVKNKLDENFIKSLLVIASGISRNNDPYELVNGVFEYLKKNWESFFN